MEDLFGHNRRPLMPRTAELERTIYHNSQSEAEDYRGIKDMDFGLEVFSMALEKRGYLKSTTRTLDLLGTGIPKIDSYIYESITTAHGRLFIPGFDDIQRLIDMSGDDFESLANDVPSDYAYMSPLRFKYLNDLAVAVETLNQTMIDEVLQAVAEVCSTEFDISTALTNFASVGDKLEGLVDDILAEQRNCGNEIYIGGGNNKTRLHMVQEDFEATMVCFKETLPLTEYLDKQVLNISCKVQNIIGHCIRIERDYGQFTDEGRPTRGKLGRFARAVEKVPYLLDRYLQTLVDTSMFVNTIIGLHKD